MQNIPYNDLDMFMDWMKTKSELKFNPTSKPFPIIPNCIYWAFMGCNIGSEEGKHRPVLVTRTYPNSTTIAILPLTTQRLNDGKQYHVDLEQQNSTVLVEQMRVIDIARIDKPMRKNGSIVSITEKDWKTIDFQIKREYLITPLPSIRKNNTNIK